MISLRRKKEGPLPAPEPAKTTDHSSLIGRVGRLFRRTAPASTKPCPRCHTRNPSEVLYCKECGSRYPPDGLRETEHPVVHREHGPGTQEAKVPHKKTLLEKGNAFYKSGRYQEALEMYDQAIRIDGEYAKAWNNRSLVLKKMGREREALESRDRFLALQDSSQRPSSTSSRFS
ncbi:MAG: Tetratricopeptide repeat protein [Methanoregulaceae archaeon PtaU1.Bin222]|nr:MAG: Tetratricopeptide repeat protein [Methanoregulaceae archaeon PtaU1.Bin222]